MYLGANGRFTLYEDEGDGQGYREGAFSTIDFNLKWRSLSIGPRTGSYPGVLETRRFRLKVYDGKSVTETSVLYTGKPLTVKL